MAGQQTYRSEGHDLGHHLLVAEAVEIDGVHPAGGGAYAAALAEHGVDLGMALFGIDADRLN